MDAANQTESSKKKILGSKNIKDTIKEGHNFIAHDSKLADETSSEQKLQKSSTINATIEEGKKFLEQSKPKRISINIDLNASKDKAAGKKSADRKSERSSSKRETSLNKSSGKKRGRPSNSKKKEEAVKSLERKKS